MAPIQVHALMPRCCEPALPGTWKLAAGRAITLEPREPGVLKVAHGQVWATYDGPHRGRLNESGDHFLGVGQEIRLTPGERLVIEAWNDKAPAYFSWDPVAVPSPVRRLLLADVVQPLSDLRLALVFGGHAAARLVASLAALAWQSTFGPRQTFEEQACGRHGAMT